MRTRTGNWYECQVEFEKMSEEGQTKKVKEVYTVSAVSFGDAETSVIRELQAYGELSVKKITPTAYKEVLFSENAEDDRWYKAKLQFITMDENTEKERRANMTYLVQADSLIKAHKYIVELMGKTMIDYVTSAVQETNIMDVFESHPA